MLSLVALLAVWAPEARAGVLALDIAVPVELRLEGTSVLRTFGALTAEVDLAAGPASLEIVRDGKSQVVDVNLPVQGRVQLTVKADSVKAAAGPPQSDGTGALELHAEAGKTFSLVMDGAREIVFGARFPVTLPALPPGPHSLELRSADLTLVWCRGTLVVAAGDALVLDASEGHLARVTGREGAWRPDHADTPAPDAPPRDDQTVPDVNSSDPLGR